MGYWIYWAEKSELTFIKRWERFPSHPQIPVGDIVYIYDGSGIGWFAAAGQDLESCYRQAAFLVQAPFVMLHMELLCHPSLRTLMEDLPILALGGRRFFPIDAEDGEWIMGTFKAGETARPFNTIATAQAASQMPLFQQLDTPSEPQWEGPTEAERNTIERLTQGAFRNRVMQFWGGACCVTGVAAPHFLRASHIKPWALATDQERMDPHNGLLLAINFDFAFDCGLISFDDAGAVIIHHQAEETALGAIGVRAGAKIQRCLCPAQCAYLEHHRMEVFGGWLRNPKQTVASPGTR